MVIEGVDSLGKYSNAQGDGIAGFKTFFSSNLFFEWKEIRT